MYFTTWLVPTGIDLKKFQAAVTCLSQGYSTSVFEPHVTLLGGFQGVESEVIEKAHMVARSLKPFYVTFSGFGFTDNLFKAVYLQCDRRKTLLSANELARAQFGCENDPPYDPHLSLLYGDFPLAEKQKMVPRICTGLPSGFLATTLHLFRTPDNDPRARVKLLTATFSLH